MACCPLSRRDGAAHGRVHPQCERRPRRTRPVPQSPADDRVCRSRSSPRSAGSIDAALWTPADCRRPAARRSSWPSPSSPPRPPSCTSSSTGRPTRISASELPLVVGLFVRRAGDPAGGPAGRGAGRHVCPATPADQGLLQPLPVRRRDDARPALSSTRCASGWDGRRPTRAPGRPPRPPRRSAALVSYCAVLAVIAADGRPAAVARDRRRARPGPPRPRCSTPRSRCWWCSACRSRPGRRVLIAVVGAVLPSRTAGTRGPSKQHAVPRPGLPLQPAAGAGARHGRPAGGRPSRRRAPA